MTHTVLPTTRPRLIVIGGPTASGKTALSISLAQMLNCPILSSDSRQFYREMTIGTAKPNVTELSAAPHHFIDHLSIHDNYSVGDYERDALTLLSTLYERHEVAIMVGGTGLYARSVCEGLDDFPHVPDDVKTSLQLRLAEHGISALQQELRKSDPNYYDVVDVNNPHRLIRALSVIAVSGKPYSSFLNQPKAERTFDVIKIAILPDRDQLYKRINDRVDQMIASGLIEEARELYPHRHLNSLNTVGYKELFRYFDGDWTEAQAIDKIKQHSRNYAKRQMTWFRNQGEWHSAQKWSAEDIKRLVSSQS